MPDVCYICGRRNGEKLVIRTEPEERTVTIEINSPTDFMRVAYPNVGICQVCDLIMYNVSQRVIDQLRADTQRLKNLKRKKRR